MSLVFYIKLNDNNDLVIMARKPVYCGDNLSHNIIFLVPKNVGDVVTQTATVYLSYIRADETADIVLLERMEKDYNESYHQFTFPVTCTMTRYPGELVMFLQIFSGPPHNPVVTKSGECFLQVMSSTNMDEYISDRNLSLIDQMQRYMDSKVEKAEQTLNERIDKTDEVVAAKADNIVFDEENSTIQLVATISVEDKYGNDMGIEQVLIGDPIFIRTAADRGVVNMEIVDGDLIATYSDGTTQNLGWVVGKDGAVYVPHIDEHKVLTFTIQSEPGELSGPTDMNPNDEWVDMGMDDGEKG